MPIACNEIANTFSPYIFGFENELLIVDPEERRRYKNDGKIYFFMH